MLFTSGICAWIVKDPGPPPWVPGNGSEFSPRQPHPARTVVSSVADSSAATARLPITIHPRVAASCPAGRRPDRFAAVAPRRGEAGVLGAGWSPDSVAGGAKWGGTH